MSAPNIKVKIVRRPTLKLKVLPKFPASVTATSPIILDRTGGNYNFSLASTGAEQVAATTFRGNPTSALASPQDFTIQGLTARGAPDANNDKIPLYDNAAGTIKYVTPGQIAAASASGVSSLGGATGAVTLDSTLAMTGNQLGVSGVLTGARTYYVDNTLGSDSNNGLAAGAGHAFKTIQKAINVVYTLNLNGFSVIIQVADGAYTAGGSFARPFLGGTVLLNGNTTTPSNVVVTLSSGGNVFQATGGAQVTIKGFKVSNAVAGAGLYAAFGGFITADRMDFGTVVGDHVEAADQGAISLFNGSYTISGGGSGHWHAHGGNITSAYNTITITGTPAFAAYFAGIAAGSIQCQNNTFVGSATGPRFLIHYLGFMLTGTSGSLSYLPGSTAGSLIDGGQYDQRFNGGAHEIAIIDNPTGFGTNSPTLQFQKAGVVQADIYDDGANTVVANAAHTAGMFITHGASVWTAVSDRRLKAKANARPVSVLDKLDGVRLVEWGDNYREIGVIAQDFVAAFPHLVNVGDDEDKEITTILEPGSWSMMYDRAGVIALQGLKEAMLVIRELRAELDRLKATK